MLNKMLVFDMDGTIVDLYGVKDWLKMLREEDDTPYKVAKPLYDMGSLNFILGILKEKGWKIVVTTWLSKESSDYYDEKVKRAKVEWLNNMSFPYDEIYITKYGVLKNSCTEGYGGFQILIDDNMEIRNKWTLGAVINPRENILEKLVDLI